jgi:AcrR family transcriptional regulator
MTSKTPRGPYAKSSRVREAIVEAALEEFSSTGYRGATMAAVAERVGMTLPGLKYYFAKKDHLLQAVLEERDDRDTRRATATDNYRTNLLAALAHTQEHAGFAELHCILSAEATDPNHPAHDYFRTRYAILREQIQLAVEQGAIKTPFQSKTMAVLMLAVLDGVQLQWLLEKDAIDISTVVAEFIDTVAPPIEESGSNTMV